MAESLTNLLVIHFTPLGLSLNDRNHSCISRFSETFGSGILSNSWRAKLKTQYSCGHSSCINTSHNKFVSKVFTVENDEEKQVLDDVFEPSIVSENSPQFLEEKDEQNLSWRLLKLSRKDKVRSALKLFVSMHFIGLKPDSHACNALLSCLLRNNKLDHALKVFESMKSSARTSEHSYNLIIQGLAKARGFEAAFETFDNLVNDEAHRNKLDVVLYNMMLTLCREAKDWRKSERIWRTMKDNNNRVGNSLTFRLLVTTFLTFCQYELAIEAYQEMVQDGVQPDSATLEAVVMAFVKDGRWDSALNVFRDMTNANHKPNVIILNALIHSLGNHGQVNLAFRVYDRLKSLGHEPTGYTWNALLVSLLRAERYGDALLLFERVQYETPGVVELHLYNTALTACQRLGAWRRALQIVWEMEGLGMCVPVTSYGRVIGACEVGNEPEVALKVYQHMVHRNVKPDTFTLLSLIRSCIWGSLWDEVLQILKLVPPNAHLYNAAIQGFCLRWKINSATKLYQEMRELGLTADGKTWAMMLRHLPKS